MKTILATAALLAAVTAVPALAADNHDANNGVCLYRHQIDGWGDRDNHSMVVNDVFGRKYLLSLAGVCSDLRFSLAAGVKPFGGGDPCVSRGDHIVMRGGGTGMMPSACWVTKVQPYTKEMQDADRAARAEHKPLPSY